jgi:hypothetical protein
MSRGGWYKADDPNNITPFNAWSMPGEACHKISAETQWANEVCSDIQGPESAKRDIQSVIEILLRKISLARNQELCMAWSTLLIQQIMSPNETNSDQ